MGAPRFRIRDNPTLERALNTLAEAIDKVEGKPIHLGRGMTGTADADGWAIESDGEESEAAPIEYDPWDLFSMEGVGDPNSEGLYSSYELKIWPGNFGGVVPTGMFETMTVGGSGISYLIVDASMGSGSVQSAEISFESSHPAPQAETLAVPPSTLKWVVGAFVEGYYFNVGLKNLSVTPRETFRESDPSATPYALPYRSYYVWQVL